MNYPLRYPWEALLSAHLPSLKSWQHGAVARQVITGEQVESAARRWRRFLDNEAFPLEAFFGEWTAGAMAAIKASTNFTPKASTRARNRVAKPVLSEFKRL